MLVAYCRLCCHCRNLAEGGCLLSWFHFTCCRYFLGHVTRRNLPWQGLSNCTEAPIKRLQVICCEKSNFQLLSYLRRQLPTFCDAATGLPVKWRLRNEHRNSMLMMCHYPNLGSASGWSKFPTWHDQSEHPDQGSYTSLAWNFCACF